MGSNSIKLLHVVNIYFVIPYFMGGQFEYFRRLEYDIHVVCSPSSELEGYAALNEFSCKEIMIRRSFSVIGDLCSLVLICTYIIRNNINVVVGHTPKGALLAMLAAFLLRVPKRIYFRHGLVYETSLGLKRRVLLFVERLTASLATQVVCVSQSVYTKALEDHLNCADKQVVLHQGTCNGIDVDRFCVDRIDEGKSIELRRRFGVPDNSFVIGYVGRLVRDKGIIELVEAIDVLISLRKNVHLLLVGMYEERDSLPMALVERIDSGGSITLTGYIDNREIERFYGLMDVFVLPSYREGFPTSVLEASSMELPVLVSRVTGCVDAIIDNETGVFIEHNAASISATILDLMENENKRALFGAAGRAFVIKNFSQKKIWSCLHDLYKT